MHVWCIQGNFIFAARHVGKNLGNCITRLLYIEEAIAARNIYRLARIPDLEISSIAQEERMATTPATLDISEVARE